MNQDTLKKKLLELRDRWPVASFEYIWNKAHEELGATQSYHEHAGQAEQSTVISKPQRVEGGWFIEI
jgi:hypothetical protein